MDLGRNGDQAPIVLEKGQTPADLEPVKIFRRAAEPPPN
jgi:hypothetical protein